MSEQAPAQPPAPDPNAFQYPQAFQPQAPHTPGAYELWLERANARAWDAQQAYARGQTHGSGGVRQQTEDGRPALTHEQLVREVLPGIGQKALSDAAAIKRDLNSGMRAVPARGNGPERAQHARIIQQLGDRARDAAARRYYHAEPGAVLENGRPVKPPAPSRRLERLGAQAGARVLVREPKRGPALVRSFRRAFGINAYRDVWRRADRLTPLQFLAVDDWSPVQLPEQRRPALHTLLGRVGLRVLRDSRVHFNQGRETANHAQPGPLEHIAERLAQQRTRWVRPRQGSDPVRAERVMYSREPLPNPQRTPRRRRARPTAPHGGEATQQTRRNSDALTPEQFLQMQLDGARNGDRDAARILIDHYNELLSRHDQLRTTGHGTPDEINELMAIQARGQAIRDALVAGQHIQPL